MKRKIHKYRGYTWTSNYNLSIKLGYNAAYVANQKYRYGLTPEQVIDKVLDKTRIYRGITWRNDSELSLVLGKSRYYVSEYKRKGMTHEQIIDM